MITKTQLSPEVSLSRIVYGMWRLCHDEDTSPAHIQAKIEACLAQGITSIDQADVYGRYEAEELLGSALNAAPELKDQIEIISKCGIIVPVGRHSDARVKYYDTSRDHIEASVDMSLKLMGVEALDILLIHRPDPFIDPALTGRCLDDLVNAGKIKAAGVSNFRPYDMDLLQRHMHTRLVTNQIELSLLSSKPFSNGDIAHLQAQDCPPMAWSPLAGGVLFEEKNKALLERMGELAQAHEVDVSAIAIAWLLAHPAGILPVMGTNTIGRIETLSQGDKVKIDRQTWFELYSLANGNPVP